MTRPIQEVLSVEAVRAKFAEIAEIGLKPTRGATNEWDGPRRGGDQVSLAMVSTPPVVRVGERASPRTEEEWQALLARYPMCRAEALPASAFANPPALKTLSVAAVMRFTPCGRYPQAEVERLAGLIGKAEATVAEVLVALKGQAPAEDLLWLATQPGCYAHPDRVLRWLAADFAAEVLPIVERDSTDRRSRRGIEAARLFALDAIDDAARAAARDAARDAAWEAARDADWDAAREAAWAAAWDAAWAAAWDAAWADARDAAWGAAKDAARAAAHLRQVERVIALLGGDR